MAQIKNVVFDMGGVLMDFNPALFSRLYTACEKDAAALEAALFCNASWALLDAGVISEPTMERIAQAQLPERLWDALHQTLADWHNHLQPIQSTNDLAERLDAAGTSCYLLSNAGTRWWLQKDRIPCLHVLRGFVVSAFERMMKPDPTIYLTLCERYRLDPAECLFVDDNADNVRGAEAAGMQGYLFDNAEGLEAFLREHGVELR